MATSSLFKRFIVSGEEDVTQFINDIEDMLANPVEVPEVPNARFITDKVELEAIMRKQKERYLAKK